MSTLSIAEVAQVTYTEACVRLDDLAREMAASGQPINAAKIRHKAAIAYRAAKAEQIDPDPVDVVPCGVCHGVRLCDWETHLAVTA